MPLHPAAGLKEADFPWTFSNLTLFFPMLSFDPPENIKNPKVFSCFQGDRKVTLGRKKLKFIFWDKGLILSNPHFIYFNETWLFTQHHTTNLCVLSFEKTPSCKIQTKTQKWNMWKRPYIYRQYHLELITQRLWTNWVFF